VDADARARAARLGLAHVVQDLLEGLAVEQRFLNRHATSAPSSRDVEVRLVDLRQAGVDHLLVELVLLLEAEDLAAFSVSTLTMPLKTV